MGVFALLKLAALVFVAYKVLPIAWRYSYIMKWHVKEDLDTLKKGAVAKEYEAELRAKDKESDAPSVLPTVTNAENAAFVAPEAVETVISVEPEVVSAEAVIDEVVEVDAVDFNIPAYLRSNRAAEIVAKIAAQEKVVPTIVEVVSSTAKKVVTPTYLTPSEVNFSCTSLGTVEAPRF